MGWIKPKKCHTNVPLNSKAIRLCNHFQSWRNKKVLDNVIRTFFLNYSRWGIFTFCVACEQKSKRHSCSSGYAIIRCRSALIHRAVLYSELRFSSADMRCTQTEWDQKQIGLRLEAMLVRNAPYPFSSCRLKHPQMISSLTIMNFRSE
jgi:hypothetical protein